MNDDTALARVERNQTLGWTAALVGGTVGLGAFALALGAPTVALGAVAAVGSAVAVAGVWWARRGRRVVSDQQLERLGVALGAPEQRDAVLAALDGQIAAVHLLRIPQGGGAEGGGTPWDEVCVEDGDGLVDALKTRDSQEAEVYAEWLARGLGVPLMDSRHGVPVNLLDSLDG